MNNADISSDFQGFLEDYSTHIEQGTAGQFLGYTEHNYYELETYAHDFYTKKRYKKAAIMLEGLISLNASRPYPYLLLGEVLMAQQKYDEALAMLEKADALEPDHITTKLKIGELHLKKGENEQATEVFEKAMTLEVPDDLLLKKTRVKVLLHNLKTRPLTQESSRDEAR